MYWELDMVGDLAQVQTRRAKHVAVNLAGGYGISNYTALCWVY